MGNGGGELADDVVYNTDMYPKATRDFYGFCPAAPRSASVEDELYGSEDCFSDCSTPVDNDPDDMEMHEAIKEGDPAHLRAYLAAQLAGGRHQLFTGAYCRVLLEREDSAGLTPHELAAKLGHMECLEALEEQADLLIAGGPDGGLPLGEMFAISRGRRTVCQCYTRPHMPAKLEAWRAENPGFLSPKQKRTKEKRDWQAANPGLVHPDNQPGVRPKRLTPLEAWRAANPGYRHPSELPDPALLRMDDRPRHRVDTGWDVRGGPWAMSGRAGQVAGHATQQPEIRTTAIIRPSPLVATKLNRGPTPQMRIIPRDGGLWTGIRSHGTCSTLPTAGCPSHRHIRVPKKELHKHRRGLGSMGKGGGQMADDVMYNTWMYPEASRDFYGFGPNYSGSEHDFNLDDPDEENPEPDDDNPDDMEMHEAAEQGDADRLQAYLTRELDHGSHQIYPEAYYRVLLQRTNAAGHTVAEVAAQHGHLNCLEVLEKRSDGDDFDANALVMAALHGQLEICRYFLMDAAGWACRCRRQKDGMTVLHAAAELGNKELLELIFSLKPGADVFDINTQDTHKRAPHQVGA
ncbi:hypothetical protein WJX72_002178 [[Myrmecia] bisecta]|uniref:Uncharacterized protein n=1 Tax=[Myrmecia] bisecta TaxID=41462 RepID=A0AAW1PB59_9CHLO